MWTPLNKITTFTFMAPIPVNAVLLTSLNLHLYRYGGFGCTHHTESRVISWLGTSIANWFQVRGQTKIDASVLWARFYSYCRRRSAGVSSGDRDFMLWSWRCFSRLKDCQICRWICAESSSWIYFSTITYDHEVWHSDRVSVIMDTSEGWYIRCSRLLCRREPHA